MGTIGETVAVFLAKVVGSEGARRPAPERKLRQGTEVVCDYAFRPLAHLVVLALLPLRVPPPAVVLAASGGGLGAAWAIASGHLVWGALLLQVKTLLDNADGQLARASGRVSAFGRYLDTELDLVVNAAVFAALGYATDAPLLALAAFLVLTLVLSADFNLERLYRRERREAQERTAPAAGLSVALAALYRLLFAPQDRLIEALAERRLRRLGADRAVRLAYHDAATVTVLANLGLSTQLAALGLCLALGQPAAYLWAAAGCGVVLVPLGLRRELRARRALRRADFAVGRRCSEQV